MRVAILSLLLMLSGAACSGDAMDARAAFTDASAAALADAVAADDATAVRSQVQAGADPNARGDKGVNLLQIAMLAQAKDALRALLDWDGLGHPAGPWIKCKGAGIDLLNPALTA